MLQNFINKQRYWHHTGFSRFGKFSKEGIEFCIMTYNVLSQNLLLKHPALYYGCNHEALKWPNRGIKICQEIRQQNVDILCLQEVDSLHHSQLFKPFLNSLGFDGIYKKCTNNKNDGCALYYKTNKFTLLESFNIEFHRKDLTSLLNRDNIAIIGLFTPNNCNKRSPVKLIVATTHLLFNPTRGDIKLAQMRVLLAELNKITSDNEINHIIICGDMNLKPYSPLYKFITEGKIDLNGLRSGDISGQVIGRGRGQEITDYHLNISGINRYGQFSSSEYDDNNDFKIDNSSLYTIEHRFNFSSVYPAYSDNNLPFVSMSTQAESSLVDYIFYTKSSSFELSAYLKLLDCEQIRIVGPLPNDFLASDHLSLVAKFLIK